MEREPARPIQNLDDVRRVLQSVKASDVELLECAQVARSIQRQTSAVQNDELRREANQLRRQAAQRLLDGLSERPKPSSLDVFRAAQHVVYSHFGESSDLISLRTYLEEAAAWLKTLMQTEKFASGYLDDLLETVSKALILAADSSDQSRTELCGALRKLECPQVAITVIEPVATHNPENHYALTTYGAALIDIGSANKAITVLQKVIQALPKGVHALTALSRAYSQIDQPVEAHRLALNAFNVSPNLYTAHRLLSSAAEIDDDHAFRDALSTIQDSLDHANAALSRNILLLSAEELVDANKLDPARTAIVELKKHGWRGDQAKRVSRLSRWLENKEELT